MPPEDKKSDYQHWTTTVKIPDLNERTAKAFIEMIYVVSKLAKVPKRAEWKSEIKDNYYTITAIFKEIKYHPLKNRPKFKIRRLK